MIHTGAFRQSIAAAVVPHDYYPDQCWKCDAKPGFEELDGACWRCWYRLTGKVPAGP